MALHFSPDFISPMFHQGLMFRRTKDFNDAPRFHEALRSFSRVQELLPGDKTVYIQRGMVYQDMGNHSFAIMDFEEAIRIDPGYSVSYFHLGVSKLKLVKLYFVFKLYAFLSFHFKCVRFTHFIK